VFAKSCAPVSVRGVEVWYAYDMYPPPHPCILLLIEVWYAWKGEISKCARVRVCPVQGRDVQEGEMCKRESVWAVLAARPLLPCMHFRLDIFLLSQFL